MLCRCRPKKEKNEKSKIVDILFTRIGVELVSKIVAQGNIFNLNRWRKEENEQNHRGFLLIALPFHRKLKQLFFLILIGSISLCSYSFWRRVELCFKQLKGYSF